MNGRKPRVLLVEPDPDLLEILVSGFAGRMDPRITCVDSADSALEVDLGEPHDLVITELRLRRFGGLRLASQLVSAAGFERPVVLLADRISGRRAVETARVGVRDIFIKPFMLSDLLDRAEELLEEYAMHRQFVARYHRMRELVRRVIRERRHLNHRTELICRDLVGAHRRLVHRVLEFEGQMSRQE